MFGSVSLEIESLLSKRSKNVLIEGHIVSTGSTFIMGTFHSCDDAFPQ